ncbi:uncharacterized protein F36G3.2-like [Oppia nitens]|uniref:uncharacterized protein F36G3.2-like n=1 Tax=Oppia nitens TaxID=1686743 RepID=UPI0023DB6198|nr:uncharacterized protein F36G3.2-like [Oppia nitens]
MSVKKVSQYLVRELRVSDADSVRQIWTESGFMAMKYGPEIWRKSFSEGLFVAEDVSTGQVIGYCDGVNLTNDLAFIGGYSVKPEYRGQGIGAALWAKAVTYMGTDRNIALFAATQAMGDYYRTKCGFGVVPDRRLVHMTGQVVVNDDIIKNIDGITLSVITNEILPLVVKYDSNVCAGLNRTVYIKELTKSPDTWNLVAINENRDVVGYCIIYTTTTEVTMVGPLYADNDKIAELLVGQCCHQLPVERRNNFLYYCWNTNDKSIGLAKRLGLTYLKDRPFLFNKKLVDGQLDKQFCISNSFLYPY